MADPGRPVTLVGLRGSGKSTVGRLLAGQLQWPFLDLDEELARRFGEVTGEGQESPGAILQRIGESSFRDLEERTLGEILDGTGPLVLATGGGAVLRPANRTRLAERSLCIWLRAEPGELHRRLSAPGEAAANPRPPLTDLDPAAELEHLATERAEHYAAVAEIRCETGGRTPEMVAAEIFSQLPQ